MINHRAVPRLLTIILAVSLAVSTKAVSEFSFEDLNQNGEIRAVAIGDSITFGVGDGVASSEFVEESPTIAGTFGFPGRLETLLGFFIDNEGEPGERLSDNFLIRFAGALRSSAADYVFILGGSNDAILTIDAAEYRASLQKLINISVSLGVEPILLTIPPSCCNRSGLSLFTRSYSREVRELAAVNDLALADLELAFDQSCPILSTCSLLNRPEGLHPNTAGYDVIAQTIADATIGPVETPEDPVESSTDSSTEEVQ